ncbi:restriction endonuclease [Methylomicrobium lacus]|uniref:restriction endonuclease n=1 Tax=Methylomicrobium lacus TaxID=136992 RepID=UPI0035A95EEB
MARKSSAFEDLIELAALLPWWLSLIMAAVFYAVLHHFASVPVPVITDTKQLGSMMTGQMIKTFATFGQYLVPLAFGLGALVSVIKRKKRANLFQSVAKQSGKSALNNITWREFEMLVGEWFRRQDYMVTETGGVADGGVDLILTKAGETYLVQCKHWKAYKVGVNIVRELLGVMVSKGAAGGYLVTSGVFTNEARRFAEDSHIELIDGSKLSHLLAEARTAQSAKPVGHPIAQTQPQAFPPCPKCGSAMVRRKATKGAHAGNSFWGCSRFPSCRSTLPFN